MYQEITSEDQKLIDAATDVIRRNYTAEKHTVGSAVLCENGKIFTGVNIDTCAYGPCAEPITLGAAISRGERKFMTIVAVRGTGAVIPPCGNCRQMLLDFAADINVIVPHDGKLMKTSIKDLLPDAYYMYKPVA